MAGTAKTEIRNQKLEVRRRGMRTLFTVGHSNWEFPGFVELLHDSQIELLVDVRSKPHSSRFPQFSQPGFEMQLKAEEIDYLFLGDELGGRPDDPDAYQPNGVVDYAARRKSYAFRAGVERLVMELEKRAVAIMCAEEDPLECHRFLMVCPELVGLGIQPLHLRKDTDAEPQELAETRLLSLNGFGSVAVNTLFPEARTEALERAFALQAEKFAFRIDPHAVERW
jgi:uncharacterized protein (DUF488 family)